MPWMACGNKMRKNTDLHLKTRTVTVKNVSRSFLRYCAGAKKKCFVRTQEFMFLVRFFWVF